VSDRNREPPQHEIVTRLRNPQTGETEPAVALLGFVGAGRDDRHIRLYPDIAYQRWMDVAKDDILDSAPFVSETNAADGRTVVWVDRDNLNEPLFGDDAIETLNGQFTGPWISTWALIPDSRYVAAELLDLLAPWAREQGEEGRYS
jgi:hypothetical protein